MAERRAADTRLNRLLNLILESGVESLGFSGATVTARYGDELTTVAATDQRFVGLDDAQYMVGEGPCLAVLDGGPPLLLRDARSDPRWEIFRQTAEQMGVATTLSLRAPLETPDGVACSVNLYSHRALEIRESDIRSAEAFSAHVGAAVESVEEYQSLARVATGLADAMRSRAVIEQAKGMLMAERQIDANDAFDLLRSISQKTNIKLRDVARRLVEERSGAPAENPAGSDLPDLAV